MSQPALADMNIGALASAPELPATLTFSYPTGRAWAGVTAL